MMIRKKLLVIFHIAVCFAAFFPIQTFAANQGMELIEEAVAQSFDGESLDGESPGEVSDGESPGESDDGESLGESEGTSRPGPAPSMILQEEVYTDQGESYYYLYPEEQNGEVVCLILLPSDMDRETFLADTEWSLFAGLEHFQILCLEADWEKDAEGAESYFENIYMYLSEQLSDLEKSFSVFLIGYEDGAYFAEKEALLHTDRYTGLVTFGGNGIPKEELESYGEQYTKIPLSVWINAPKKSSELNAYLTYWKTADQITGDTSRSYQQAISDELFLPATSTVGRITGDSERMGVVLFSRISEYYNHTISGEVTRNFISKVRKNEVSFLNGVTGGEVFQIDDFHFTYYRRQYDGQQRDYWLYVPDSVIRTGEPASLILCLHGSGGTGEDMIFRSRWHETAKKHNCIIIYPTSLNVPGLQHYWMNEPEEINFLRELVSSACEKYVIDSSRIYVTGFSNGAGMASNLAIRCADIFAAAALGAPAYFDAEYFGPVDHIFPVAVLFSYGSEDKYLKEYNTTADIDAFPAISHLDFWRNLYGFRQDMYRFEKYDELSIYTFYNHQSLPVCKWMIVEGKRHEYPSEECDLFYDFMQNYTKGADGTLFYQGKEVKPKMDFIK